MLVRILCNLSVLFCCYYTNTTHTCSTNTIGGLHRFLPPSASQEPMVALPFRPPDLNCQSARTHLSPSGTPARSSQQNLPLQAIFEPTSQLLWASTVFFIRLHTPPIHFRTDTPSTVSQSHLFIKLPAPSSHFWTYTLSAVSQSCHSYPYYLPHQDIFEPIFQALWSNSIIPHHITCPSKTFLNWHDKCCESVPLVLIGFSIHQWLLWYRSIFLWIC